MNKRTIIFIIFLASISLLGIAVTQLFWVRNALNLKEEQINHRVRIALKGVENELLEYSKDTTLIKHNNKSCPSDSSAKSDLNATYINPHYLDSLIRDEFMNLNLHIDYKYGVYHNSDKKFVMGDFKGYTEEIVKSEHSISLTCICKADSCTLGIYLLRKKNFLFGNMYGWILLSGLFLIIFVIIFSYVMLSLVRQKKLSEMKTDFVNNMTHEFKTPISTISLASEMLLKPRVNQSSEKTEKYANIIYDENSRLKNQVEQVLQIAVLDKGNFKLKKKEVNLHEIIEMAVDNFEMIIKQRCGKIITSLDADMATFYADPIHITNIIHNLMDNANKYSPEIPEISISTRNNEKGIILSVEDKGIGISPENQKHIFKKFFRVHTGNIHDVKGFGLGLYYVKTIVDIHGGTINLVSELKKGTKIEIYFPFIQN